MFLTVEERGGMWRDAKDVKGHGGCGRTWRDVKGREFRKME
jgi:hypothetical protein